MVIQPLDSLHVQDSGCSEYPQMIFPTRFPKGQSWAIFLYLLLLLKIMKCEMTMKMDKCSYSSLFKMGQMYILEIRNALIHYDLKKCFSLQKCCCG